MEGHSRLRTFRFSSSYQNVLTDSLIQIQRLSDCKKASIANGKDPPLHSAQPRAFNLQEVACVSTVYLSTYHCISRNACQLHREIKIFRLFRTIVFQPFRSTFLSPLRSMRGFAARRWKDDLINTSRCRP